MKKSIKLLYLVSLLLLCVIMLASCGEMLDAPTGIVLDSDTLTISWNKVEAAKSYTVQIEGQDREKNTKSNFISLEFLDEGEYEIKIRAVGTGDYRDSKWTKYEFKRPEENGLKYALINSDTAYAVRGAGSAEGAVIIPDTYRGKPVVSIADKAFYNNSKITSVTIGNNVTSIGEKAFTKSSALVSVIIPDSVKTIGTYAFQSCKALTSISIPDSVTVIEPFTFSRCDLLASVDLGSSIVKIGEYAFSSCSSLASITIPDTTTYIGQYAFSDCSEATSLTLGANLKEIDAYAFYNCAKIPSLTFASNLKYIRYNAFGNCASIPSIVIPDSVERIEYSAFEGCEAVTEITLGTGLKNIGNNAFTGTQPYVNAGDIFAIDGWLLATKNKEIENLEIPDGVYGLAEFAITECKKLKSLEITGIKYVCRAAFYKCTDLWEIIFDDSLISIGENAFRDCKKLTDITLGNNLETIDSYAFMGCSMLYEMDLPDSLETIGGYAFKDTLKFKTTTSGIIQVDDWVVGVAPPALVPGYYESLNIDESVRAIANYAFYGIPIGYIYMPDSVKSIGKGAFYGNAFPFSTGISIRLSEELEYIGDYAFYGCANWFFGDGDNIEDRLKLTIPDTVKYVGRSAFYKCQYIVSLEIPGSVETIGKYAFYGCSNIGKSNLVVEEDAEPLRGEIKLGEGIVSIGAQAFRNCTGIESLVIPSTVTYIGEKAFFMCSNLKELTLSAGLSEISDYAFYKCTALETLTIPSGIKEIGAYAFRGNTSLTSINLGSVEVIDHHAFLGCSAITYINLPSTVTDVKDFAFRGCTAATSVTIPDTVTSIGKHAFYGVTSATLYVESDTIPAEWDANFNSTFRPIIIGCELSSDSSYVVSFTKNAGSVINENTFNGTSAPACDGYRFIGWTSADATYTAQNVNTAPDGTVLYANWEKITDN